MSLIVIVRAHLHQASASTLQQLCDDAPEWVFKLFSSISIDFNENKIATSSQRVCVFLITGSGRRVESGKISPVGNQWESAFEGQGKSTQLKSVIPGRCYLREEFEFPGLTPLVDFIHVLCYLWCLFTCNKLFNFTGLETFTWTYLFHMSHFSYMSKTKGENGISH